MSKIREIDRCDVPLGHGGILTISDSYVTEVEDAFHITITTPSYADESGYLPAESVDIIISASKIYEVAEWILERRDEDLA